MDVIVLTVDQRGSRRTVDRIPDALTALADVPLLLAFERTVGDEFQGVLDDPEALPRVVETLLRDGEWNIGIGVGEIDDPLPDHARAGRGTAYLQARDAVTAAKSSPWRLRVCGEPAAARALETTLWLWASVLARRTSGGWEVADLVERGACRTSRSRSDSGSGSLQSASAPRPRGSSRGGVPASWPPT